MLRSSTIPFKSSPLVNEVHPDDVPVESAATSIEIMPEVPKPNMTASNLICSKKPPVNPIVEEMTSHIQHGRVKDMVILFYLVCRPGDWKKENMPLFGRHLKEYYTQNLHTHCESWFASIIKSEWEAALFTDQLVELFHLPLPNNQICMLWNPTRAEHLGERPADTCKRLQSVVSWDLYDTFHQPCRFETFERPRQYLTAAILQTKKSRAEMKQITTSIGEFLEQVRTFIPESPCEESLPEWVREWLLTDAGIKANLMLRGVKRLPIPPH